MRRRYQSKGTSMTDKEAMKLALEALELVNIEFVCNGAHHAKKDRHGLDEDCPVTMRYRKAIAALKERLAQPEQEPVAWRTYTGRGYYIIDPTFEDAQKNWPDKQHQPLYTHPPQRTWVDLSDEDIEECFTVTPDLYLKRHIAQRISAKLKEKNNV